MEIVPSADIFPHMRMLLSTIIGLGITRMLMTVANMVQHPRRARVSVLHILWIISLLVEMVLFWWWQFALFRLEHWTFGIALFLVAYVVALFLLAALLSPDNISDYDGYEDFFLKRRAWFFGLFAVVAVFDLVDTLIKGPIYQQSLGPMYFLQAPMGILVCLLAVRTGNRRVHLGIVITHFIYQALLITRFFDAS